MSKTTQELDQMHDNKQFDEIFDTLRKIVEDEGNEDPEYLWRYARANFDKAQELPDGDKDREAFIVRGREVSEKAVGIDGSNGPCHKWFAICLSSQGEYLPKKQKIQDAFKVKEHADKAHELMPEDGTVLHFLGRFAFTIASISWMERKLAQSFIAEPPTATYEEALEFFLKADAAREFLTNRVWIGKTYQKIGDKAKAKEWYTKVVEANPECESDKNDIKEATAALKKL